MTIMIKATVRILQEGLIDRISHVFQRLLLGRNLKIRLVSLDIDPSTKEGKLSSESVLSLWGGTVDKSDTLFTLTFTVSSDFGKPGAILLISHESNEIYLKSITLHTTDHGDIYFPCYSWINHSDLYFGQPRVFFPNQPYLPSKTPAALLKYRQHDLVSLRGDGTGERVYGQRIYDYDVYNDLGNPDRDMKLKRPVLGGTAEYPYPRRCRTGRKRTKNDDASEEPMKSSDGSYLPRDERFSAMKKKLFVSACARSFWHKAVCTIMNLLFDRSFKSLEDIYELHKQTFSNISIVSPLMDFEFPSPGIIRENKDAWKFDEEFGRQRLAGLNPMVIQRLQSFPPTSSLDPNIYGDPKSSITEADLEPLLEGFSVKEALEDNLLYILDYHDVLMPYINRINEMNGKTYASRTILYLTKCRKLVPIAIELSLPPNIIKGENARKRVFTANKETTPYMIWALAKTHVATADTGYHQLVSHWLHTHACIEPIILATKRQLSTMHPIHMLLLPHFKDTLHMNALARSSLISAGEIIEEHYTSGKYSMEISSVAYRSWRFDEQSLPNDLLKRGMAVEDEGAEHGLRLMIEDYPYAIDGLDLWKAMREWVGEYVALYYSNDLQVEKDSEVQAWWKEVRTMGHGDHAHATWWPSTDTVQTLGDILCTIIWLSSAQHAAVNFGQYAYAGFMPNQPCLSRAFIPELGTSEYKQIQDPFHFHLFYLHTIPTQAHTAFAMSILEILSQHLSEEEYLGDRNDDHWTSDANAIQALHKFRDKLLKVEDAIESRNKASAQLHHRSGYACLPYTLLAPSNVGPGMTFRGVPNSISI